MSLIEHSIFAMALQAIALGMVYSFRRLPPRLATWVCILSICSFAVPWAQIGTGLKQLAPNVDAVVLSAALFKSISPMETGSTMVEQRLHSAGIGLWVLIAVTWIGCTFLHANATLKRWRKASGSAEALHPLVHSDLAHVLDAVEVRLVTRSCLAMTSGLWRPTVWIGDAIATQAHQRTALNHELAHVKSGDQYLVVLLTVLERALWWNPVVWLLAAEARRQIEYDCDQRCKQLLGASDYTHSLAALSLLKAGIPVIPSALALQTRNGVINRMKRINQSYVTRPAHFVALAALLGVSIFASTVIAGDSPAIKPTLMECEKDIPESANWRMSIDRDPEKRTLSVSLKDLNAPASDSMPEGSAPYIRCLFSALGIPGDERPRAS